MSLFCFFFFFSSRRRHTRWTGDWSSDVCSSDLRCTRWRHRAPVRARLRGRPSARHAARPGGGDRDLSRLCRGRIRVAAAGAARVGGRAAAHHDRRSLEARSRHEALCAVFRDLGALSADLLDRFSGQSGRVRRGPVDHRLPLSKRDGCTRRRSEHRRLARRGSPRDALVLAFQHPYVVVAPAETMHVEAWAGTGRPIAVVPGLFGASFTFRKVIPLLAAQGFRPIVIEPLGTGFSSRPPKADYSLAAQSHRLAAVLDSLHSGPVLVLAHSLGAAIAFRLALDRPDLVRGIVSLEGGPTEEATTPMFRSGMRYLPWVDRKSTRLNSSHPSISYAVFCLKKKKHQSVL